MYFKRSSGAAVFVGALCVASASVADAATSAYWRHEEGTNGALIAAGPDTVLDASGNGNHMETFNPLFTSATYHDAVSPVPLRSGSPNTLSLDFGPGGDDGGLNDDNFTTTDKPVSSQLFSAITVEVAFRVDTVAGFQALVGKDGKPLGDAPGEDDYPIPPFKIYVRGDDFPGGVPNQLFVEWVDGDATLVSDTHFVAGGQTVLLGEWYHVAFTLDATTAALWVAGEDGVYALRSTTTGDFAGSSGDVIAAGFFGWTIGRGMFNNSITDWADAHIDEVRISDAVLAPNQFLFAPVPEPGSALALAGGAALLLMRRRRATN
jgi:hypothetical protein